MLFSTFVFSSGAAGATITGNPVSGFTIVNKDGTTEHVDESWEERYPYGIFALSNSEMVITEGGSQQVLTVYRMGGTADKASAIIFYQPAVIKNEDGSVTFSQAISADDIVIMVEDPLPIAQYQPWGEPPAPERTDIRIKAAEGVDGQGEPCIILSLDTGAVDIGNYQWYVLRDGEWEEVKLAEGPELPVGQEDLDTYDFRCEFELGGVRYCTDSYKGIPYEKPEPAEIPEAPDDIELNPEPTYSQLVLDENDNKYNGVVFEVCFANGEYKKDIIISAKDDTEAELDEFATITIIDSIGGEVHPSLNTLMLRVADDDAENAEPSQVGFTVDRVSFDKSSGKAVLTVKRTGGKTKAISVDWSTEDGTAIAGTDYVAGSGTLYFYGDQDEQAIEIQLINDKIQDFNEKYFTVHLGNLLGDDNSSITVETCVVGLYNSNTADEFNLVSTLYDVQAVDVSGDISEAQGAPVSTGVISGSQVSANEGLDTLSGSGESYIEWFSDDDELDPMLYRYDGKVNFNGGNWSRYVNYYISLTSRGEGQNQLKINDMGKHYSYISATVHGGAKFSSGWDRFWFGGEQYAYTAFGLGFETYIGGKYSWAITKIWDCQPEYKNGVLFCVDPFNCGSTLSYNEKADHIMLFVKTRAGHPSAEDIQAKANVTFYRRTFNNDFYIDIYTANDADMKNVAKYSKENYQGIIQKVQITNGGTYEGKLFMGSTVQIVLGNTHLTPSKAYLVNSKNEIVKYGDISGNTITFSSLILPPEETYTFKLVLDRNQNIKIDVTPSAETDASGNPAGGAEKANKAAYSLLRSKNILNGSNGKITIGYSAKNSSTGLFETDRITETQYSLPSEDAVSIKDGIVTLENPVGNIQYINFNLGEDDVILYNGKAYAGNANIWLETRDLTPKDLTFYFYEKNLLTAVRPMKVSLDSVALYFDANGNGRIDGYFDEASGVFVTQDGDQFVTYLDNIDYEETLFRPVVGSDGKVRQYFMRAYYTANPACLVVPQGHSENERMQIMPNFITDVTNPNTYESLTNEERQYRTIVSGQSKLKPEGSSQIVDIGYISDNKLKYTAKASAYSYVDIPLGGDTNPPRQKTYRDYDDIFYYRKPEDYTVFEKGGIKYITLDGLIYYFDDEAPNNLGDAVYIWEPVFYGNLLKDFLNPQLKFFANSIAGNNIPVTRPYHFTVYYGWYNKPTSEPE